MNNNIYKIDILVLWYDDSGTTKNQVQFSLNRNQAC